MKAVAVGTMLTCLAKLKVLLRKGVHGALPKLHQNGAGGRAGMRKQSPGKSTKGHLKGHLQTTKKGKSVLRMRPEEQSRQRRGGSWRTRRQGLGRRLDSVAHRPAALPLPRDERGRSNSSPFTRQPSSRLSFK